jgi:hypothetical protein
VEEQAAALAELRRHAEPFRLRARAAEQERDEQRARAEVRARRVRLVREEGQDVSG